MSPVLHPTNPTAVRRWLAAVGLAMQAEEIARGATTVDRSTALILADTAAEAGLALISSFVADRLPNTDFNAYLARAKLRARIPEATAAELSAIHRLRNGALHHGAEVGADDVGRAILTTRTLLDVYVPRVLHSARALGYGRGIADAVSTLLAAHRPISYRLDQAGVALRRRDEEAAIQHTTAALYLARMYANPRLPSPPTFPNRGIGHIDPNASRETWERSVEAWLVPMALGLTPASYELLTNDLPRATYIPGSSERGGKFHFSAVTFKPGAARRSLETVSLLVFRLWLRDSLRYPVEPDN